MQRGAILGALLGLLISSEAGAQGHGWRLGLERVAGAVYSSMTVRQTEAGRVEEVSTTLSSVNLFGSTLTARGNVLSMLSAPSPRLGLDYEFPNHLTVGLAATLMWASVELPTDGRGTNIFGFGLAPRVGYSVRLSNRLFFWPRAGVTFSRFSESSNTPGSSETILTELSINLEPTLVIAPVERVGLLLTLLGDIPLVGDQTSSPASARNEQRTAITVGLQFGVQARF